MTSEAQNSAAACRVNLIHKVFTTRTSGICRERLKGLAEEKVTVNMYERMNGMAISGFTATEHQSQR